MDEIYKTIDGMSIYVIIRSEKLITWQEKILPALKNRYPSLKMIGGSATTVKILSKTIRFIASGRDDLMFGQTGKVVYYVK